MSKNTATPWGFLVAAATVVAIVVGVSAAYLPKAETTAVATPPAVTAPVVSETPAAPAP